MQKLGLQQSLSQKLSPQQIQFIKLLQIPVAELEARIQEEMEINPILEEGPGDDAKDEPADNYDNDEDNYDGPDGDADNEDYEADGSYNDVSLDDYVNGEIAGYKMSGDGPNPNEEERDMPMVSQATLTDTLLSQLGYLPISDKQRRIGYQLIGSIENDGYIRRDLESIANDLAFGQNIEATYEEVEKTLFIIQKFDPPGIAARDLRECLLLQLERRQDSPDIVEIAISILEDCFEEFTKKHYEKIQRKLDIEHYEDLKKAVNMIIRLNPKPGETVTSTSDKVQYIIPDFILQNYSGKLELSLNTRNAPDLKISRAYAELLDTYDKSQRKNNKQIKETVTFVKQKLDSAKWFIDAIKQRQHTLLSAMDAIMRYQYEFFLDGDESKLKPMILKDIASTINMDISTVSRVANSKHVQTEFGVFPLKFFFSEGISTEEGEDVSSREVKHFIREMIEKEDKVKPLSDDKLEQILNERGYNIARRTVAKYREQLNIPVARLRKELR